MPESVEGCQVVLLGASNVAIGFRTITSLLRSGLPAPLDLRAAIGHGRSYGAWSRFGGRSLPGIVASPLWQRLDEEAADARYALLTDIGNDLLYGRSPEEIAEWVATCLGRLSERGTRCILTRLPLRRLERISATRYHATRLFFFPTDRPISWTEIQRRADRLDRLIAELAGEHGAAVVTPEAEWYGIDPIHIRRSQRRRVWRTILSSWPDFEATSANSQPGLRLLGRFPEQYRLLGRRGSEAQPVLDAGDVSLRLY